MQSGQTEKRQRYRSFLRLGAGFAVLGAAVLAAPSSGAGSAVPPELVGTWHTSSVSSTNYINRSTGSSSGPSGYERNLRIYSDGHYEGEELQQVSTYNCRTGYYGHDSGSAVVSGSKIILRSVGGTLRQFATCAHRDYTKPIDGRTLSAELSWQIVPDPAIPGGRILVLTRADGVKWAVLRYDSSAQHSR